MKKSKNNLFNNKQEQFEHLKSLTNAANLPLLNVDYVDTHQVQIIPDKNIAPALFVPDLLNPKKYRANPITIRALKKDIFVAGNEGFEDLEIMHQCLSCQKIIDLQFWHFCPYCEKSFN